MGSMTKLQRGAVYMVFFVVLTGLGRILEPGLYFGETAEWHDLVAQKNIMSDNSALERVTSLLYAFGFLWFLAALLTIWDHVRDDEVAGGTARVGVLLAGMSSLFMAVIEGLDHMALRALQDGIGAGADTDQIALSLLSAKLGIVLFLWPVFYFGIALAAFGLRPLLPVGAYQVISGIAALLAFATAVLLVLVEHVQANSFWQGLSLVLGVGILLWIGMLARAMYTGKLASSAS